MSARSPRIAINAHLLHGQGSYRSAGIHTYIAELLRHLPDADPDLQLILFTQHPPADLKATIRIETSRWKTDRPALRILWEQLVLPGVVRRAHADLLHAAAFVAPLAPSRPTVITIYDLSFALFPQYFRGFNRIYLRSGTRLSARRARRIVVISEQTRRDVNRLYDVPLERIDVAYPGVAAGIRPIDPERVTQFRCDKNLPEKFLLFLGTLEPRKNLVMLVQSLARMKDRCPDARLVLAGGVGWLADDLFAAIKKAGLQEDILRPGYVAAEEKALWYAAATAFVYPSVYEGFGLPPLEAMACGTPVIASNAAALPEVVGDAGVLIDPQDVAGWADAMQRVWQDAALRGELRDRGLRRAQKFSWRETARQTAAAYRRALE